MTIYDKARMGLPIDDCLIIDEHCHMGTFASQYCRDAGSAQSLIAIMDRMGVDLALVSHSMALTADFVMGNDLVARAAERYPGRFLGYCTVNPLYPDELKRELARCFENSVFRAIKLHPYAHQRPMSYKHYRPAYEFAAERGVFVMSHTYTEEDVEATDRLASEFPGVIFIMGHTGGEGYKIEKALDVINKHDNVYGDIAVSQSWEGGVEWYCREVGSKKILFGTDMPFMTPTATLALVAMAKIGDDEKRDIFGGNMQRILKGSAERGS
ncbi:MAG: amidohydrolase family protein [Oscillospiraceae bacterium]|nr:amidohydrolase family protein [Oscillospiraceae bacterium]